MKPVQTVPDELLQVRCPHCKDTVREIFAVRKAACVEDLPRARWQDLLVCIPSKKSKVTGALGSRSGKDIVELCDDENEMDVESGAGQDDANHIFKPQKRVIRLKKHTWMPLGMWLRSRFNYFKLILSDCCWYSVWPFIRAALFFGLFMMGVTLMFALVNVETCDTSPSQSNHGWFYVCHDDGGSGSGYRTAKKGNTAHPEVYAQEPFLPSVPGPGPGPVANFLDKDSPSPPGSPPPRPPPEPALDDDDDDGTWSYSGDNWWMPPKEG